MTLTLAIEDSMYAELAAKADASVESAAVMLVDILHSQDGSIRLFGRALRWVDDGAYSLRTDRRMTINPQGYIGALAEAAESNAVALWVHTHPGEGGQPNPSDLDEQVDRELASVFRIRTNQPYYGTLIVSRSGVDVAFTGSLELEGALPQRLDRLWAVGDRWRLVRAYDCDAPPLPALFDRNVRAFGEAIQQILGDLRVAIIGCGGTGSAVAEQLVRLGVRHLILMDPDYLTASNVTRVYGSTPEDVGDAKVDIVGRHLQRIAPDLRCATHVANVTEEASARALCASDLVFGCTDDNAGRLVLSRIATYLTTPVVDCGVLISSDQEGLLTGVDGRVTVLHPGAACLVCRGRIDFARAAQEVRSAAESQRLAQEGYAPALGATEPAVVAFTTLVAATAVSELLERLIGYGPHPRPNEILLRWHERETSTNQAEPREGHYCSPTSGKIGHAAASPFLEQIWPT